MANTSLLLPELLMFEIPLSKVIKIVGYQRLERLLLRNNDIFIDSGSGGQMIQSALSRNIEELQSEEELDLFNQVKFKKAASQAQAQKVIDRLKNVLDQLPEAQR